MNCIEVDQIVKSFGKRRVLDGVSLHVPKASVFGLLGENGAGKSTLIRGLLGYLKFDAGSVTVLGKNPMRDTFELRRQVGYVSDAPVFHNWLTVRETAWFASALYGGDFQSEFGKLATSFGLDSSQRVRDLSKGNRAKLALGLAMAFRPELLILDEPTSGLDPMVRRTFLDGMIDLAQAGQTVLLSSHNVNELERVADWVAILHQGQIQVAAPVEELKSSIQIFSFSLRDPLMAWPFEISSEQVLSQRVDGRSYHLVVRELCPTALHAFQQSDNVIDVQLQRPSLEEIYFAYCQPSKGSNSYLQEANPTSTVAREYVLNSGPVGNADAKE